MKSILQFATSLVALGAVLAGSATAATPIAELPLKMSVLAKPNVIFGMDDSGSMDSELMLYNNDGAFWWNTTTSSGWGVDAAHPNAALRTITSTWFNAVGAADTTWRKMVYLFPNGTGLGNRVYADAANDHFAILPTRQFAFLRWSGTYKDSSGVYRPAPSDPASSPVHNPLYYNPLVTYAPWAPAYISTGAITPMDATPGAAKSHPMYGTVTFDLTNTRGASTTADNVFTALPGMRVPAGAKKMVCNTSNASCGAWTNVTADENAAASSVTRVSMAYHPATYWVKETCTPENLSQVTDTCTTAPDGSTLKRYEIRSTVTSYPSGRSYTAELKNFANWFQYYRKRKMMLAGAMGQTMETLTGMRLGVLAFNSLSGNVTMYDADATSKSVNRSRVAGLFYEANGSGGTPTRETLKYIGEQFKRTDTDTASGKYNMIQYGCQRNNAFIVTDGFANASSVVMPAWDTGKSEATYGSGAPYANTYAGGLADLALRYYTNNPRPPGTTGLATGVLPANSVDTNTNLHVNTYGLTLGARGTLFLSETSPRPTSVTAWPDPSTNRSPTSVDDLWHATINGRGKMYLATTPQETATSIRAGLADILSQKATQGGVSVNTVNLVRGDSRAYLGSYNPSGWAGDLEAVNIDTVTGDLGTKPLWSASMQLEARPWSERVIATWGGTGGVSFSSGVTAVTSAVNPSAAYGTDVQVIDYLRGERTNEGTLFRTRKSLIGAVINSEPVVDRDTGVVYVASGEGMLHAIDTLGTEAGKELWAYVPGQVLTDIGQTVSRSYTFRTKLDGTPVIRKIGTTTKLLVAGMGAAGRGYYAIDVTAPRGISEGTLAGNVKWEFPSASDSTMVGKVGQTLGKPSIVRTSGGTYVVLVTSGYNNIDGKGRLWMLNAATGAVIKEFVTADGSVAAEAGLAHVSPFAEADGSVRYVYGGDLLGNVWRFDLDADVSTGTFKLAQLRGPTGTVQPVTTPPELMYYKGKRLVYVGTGRLLDIGDFGINDTQTIYAIADGTLLSNARSSLVQQVYTPGSSGTLTKNPVDWTSQRGWYMDLPAGEQVNTRPTIAYGGLAFVTNKAGSSDCSASARMYIIDVLSGSKFIGADFISTTISETSNASAVAAILTKDGKKVKGISREYNSGNPVPKDLTAGIPIPPTKNSWRETRR